MTPTTADIRRFLVDTFNDEELKILCFDYFRDVSDEFTTGMTKGQMIQLLIERCVRREALASLEAALRAERPEQYGKRFGAPDAGRRIPAETAPPAAIRARCSSATRTRTRTLRHRLAADLASAGWRAWITPDSIQPGEKWVEAIGRGLDGSGVFLVVLTPAAVGSALGQGRDERRHRAGSGRRSAFHPAGCGGVRRARFVERLSAGVVPRALRRRACGAAPAGASRLRPAGARRRTPVARPASAGQAVDRLHQPALTPISVPAVVSNTGRSTSTGSPSPPVTS